MCYRPTDGPTDQRTDQRTDRPSYRDAWTHLKIFEGEFDPAQEPAMFDERHNSDPVRRDLQSTVITLQRSLQQTCQELTEKNQELTEKNQELTERELTVTNLISKVEDLSETNNFLSKHVDALEKENVEQHQKIINNNNNNNPSSIDPAKSKSGRTVLGTMKSSELGQDAKNKTRAAYRNLRNLRDENYKKVPINVEKPHNYDNLTNEERSAVATASSWKDINRLSDKAYSSMTNIGTIPPAAHVKRYEKEVNSQLGPILPVRHYD